MRELMAVAVSAADVADSDACIWLVGSGHEFDGSAPLRCNSFLGKYARTVYIGQENLRDDRDGHVCYRHQSLTHRVWVARASSSTELAANTLPPGTTAAPPGTSEKFTIHGLERHGLPRPSSSSQIEFIDENDHDTVRQASARFVRLSEKKKTYFPPYHLSPAGGTNSQSLFYTNNYSLFSSCLTLTLRLQIPRPPTNLPTFN